MGKTPKVITTTKMEPKTKSVRPVKHMNLTNVILESRRYLPPLSRYRIARLKKMPAARLRCTPIFSLRTPISTNCCLCTADGKTLKPTVLLEYKRFSPVSKPQVHRALPGQVIVTLGLRRQRMDLILHRVHMFISYR